MRDFVNFIWDFRLILGGISFFFGGILFGISIGIMERFRWDFIIDFG